MKVDPRAKKVHLSFLEIISIPYKTGCSLNEIAEAWPCHEKARNFFDKGKEG